jgi:hypothetical protein
MRTRLLRLLLITLGAACWATQAEAQCTAQTQGLRVEPIESGFVIAPDAKFTEVNDRFATLAGVYGGWLSDRTLLIGAGAYWLTNRDHDFKMQYGGGIVRWTIGGHRTLGLSTGALIGIGDATLPRRYGDLFRVADGGTTSAGRTARFVNDARFGRGITSETPVRINDDFFIAEPQVNAIWNITGWMRLDAGVGYRLIGASDLLDDQLRGVSGSIALQFGGR